MIKSYSLKSIIVFIFCLMASATLCAQVELQKKADEELYKSADKLLKNANKALKDDDLVEAEKLYYQSLKIYPITDGFNSLAIKKMELGDVRGGNKIWDNLITSLAKQPKVLVVTVNDIILGKKYDYLPTSKFITTIRLIKASANFYKGDIKTAHEEMLILKKEGLLDMTNLAILGETSLQVGDFNSTQYVVDEFTKFYASRKDKSLLMGESTQVTPHFYAAKLALAKGEFEKAINLSQMGIDKDKTMGHKWTAQINLIISEAYLGLGDIEKAKQYYEASIKSLTFKRSTPQVAFLGGVIALAEKDYANALERFVTNLSFKAGYLKSGWIYAQQITYTKKAEAYLGLKDFVNAKKSYETALLYFPDYAPAIDGLAKLEGKQTAERRTDKTGPEIKILEPTNMRGLKIIAAGADVMIKGIAIDPSGIKTAAINGKLIYSKEEGDFWGTVPLADGVNKFEIAVTDFVGNATTQIFEIERQVKGSNEVPIAVTEKAGKNFAVFIASQNYDDQSIPSLENPIADAIKLKLILKNNYNFADDNIYSLFNPQLIDFKKKFIELKEALQPEDNLVIFYAGHGIWVDKEKKGYWLLTDAKRNDVNTWLSNKNVLDMIAELPARHTLLITDACFSGSVFKSRSIGADAPAALKEMDNKITRVAITSGNDTEVPDESVFMKYLVKALSENKDKYLTAQKMFINQIIEAVMTESKTEPRYGTLELAGHVGGDYIFSKK